MNYLRNGYFGPVEDGYALESTFQSRNALHEARVNWALQLTSDVTRSVYAFTNDVFP